MKCPKCGKVMQETNDGSYVCTPECKNIISTIKKQNKRGEK